MSILIHGMEMPKKCGQCKLFHAEQPMYCIVDKNYRTVGAPYGMPRPDWCPLIELPPHGRLIDIKSVEYGKFTTVGNEYQRWWNGALDSVIDNAPTVIEAEGEKDGSIHKRHGDSYKL